MDARIILTKDFKEKTMKHISPHRKGELRWEKLVKAEQDGTLQKATRRADIATIACITDKKKGYTWVSNMVHKQALVETIRGYENGSPIYEYHLGKPLTYRSGKRGSAKKVKPVENKPVESKPIENKQAKEVVKETTVVYAMPQITIKVKEVEFTVAMVGAKWVAELIKELK